MNNQLGIQTIEADNTVNEDNNGWDEEDSTAFDFNQPEDANDAWGNITFHFLFFMQVLNFTFQI